MPRRSDPVPLSNPAAKRLPASIVTAQAVADEAEWNQGSAATALHPATPHRVCHLTPLADVTQHDDIHVSAELWAAIPVRYPRCLRKSTIQKIGAQTVIEPEMNGLGQPVPRITGLHPCMAETLGEAERVDEDFDCPSRIKC